MLSMDYKSGLESEAEVYQGYVTLQSQEGLNISANVHLLRDGNVALATSTASTICIFASMLAAPSRSCMSANPHLSNTACQVGCSYQLCQTTKPEGFPNLVATNPMGCTPILYVSLAPPSKGHMSPSGHFCAEIMPANWTQECLK